MPDSGGEAVELREDFGDELSRALEDRVFDPDPEIRSIAFSRTPDVHDSIPPDLLDRKLSPLMAFP